MATFYAFERPAGKITYIGAENSVTGDRNIQGRLFAFSSIDKRASFIRHCPSDKCRHTLKHCEVRSLFLGMSLKGLKALLLALPVDEVEIDVKV